MNFLDFSISIPSAPKFLVPVEEVIPAIAASPELFNIPDNPDED